MGESVLMGETPQQATKNDDNAVRLPLHRGNVCAGPELSQDRGISLYQIDLTRPPSEKRNLVAQRMNRIHRGRTSMEDMQEGRSREVQGVDRVGSGSKGGAVLVYASLMLTCAIINSLGFKRMTSAMPNYSSFLSQITTVAYIPIFGLICAYMYSSGGAEALGGKEVMNYPLVNFLVMGALDACGSVLMLIGGIYTSGSNQVILSQMIIPVALGLCYVLLNKRYHLFQYGGAVTMLLGVICTKLPDFLGANRHHSNSLLAVDKPMYNLVFMCSVFPASLSAIYKEMAFVDVRMDVNWMQFWVAVFQFCIGFLLVPMQSLPVLGPQGVPMHKLLSSIRDGFYCFFFGLNTVVEQCGGPSQPQCDNCGAAWVPVINYCMINIAYNVFSLLVVKHCGATVSFMVSTLRLPLTTFAFCSPWIMGEDTVTPTAFDFMGLVILLMGLLCYRLGSRAQRTLSEEKMVAEGRAPVHIIATVLESEPLIVWAHSEATEAANWARNNVYHRLSICSPLLAPETREKFITYRAPELPTSVSRLLSKDMVERYATASAIDSLPSQGHQKSRKTSEIGTDSIFHRRQPLDQTSDRDSDAASVDSRSTLNRKLLRRSSGSLEKGIVREVNRKETDGFD